MKSSNRSYQIELWLLSWYCFFSYMRFFKITQYSAVILLGLIAIIPVIHVLGNPFVLRVHISLWVIYGVVYTLGMFSDVQLSTLIAWIIQKWMIILIVIFLSSTYGWTEDFPKIFLAFGSVHVIATILEFITPTLVHTVSKMVLSASEYSTSIQLYQYDYHCGIAQQASYNGAYIGAAIAILFGYFLSGERKRNVAIVVATFLALISMVLTGKRGLLLAIIVALGVSFIIFLIFRQRAKARYIVLIAVVIAVFAWMVMNTGIAENILRRMQYEDNFLTGRQDLWSTLISGIKEHPFFGNGSASFSTASTVSGHNSFLQIAYENGILGLVVVAAFMICGIVESVKGYRLYSETAQGKFFIMSLTFQIFFIISCMTDSLFYHNITCICYVVFYSIPFAIIGASKQNESMLVGEDVN